MGRVYIQDRIRRQRDRAPQYAPGAGTGACQGTFTSSINTAGTGAGSMRVRAEAELWLIDRVLLRQAAERDPG